MSRPAVITLERPPNQPEDARLHHVVLVDGIPLSGIYYDDEDTSPPGWVAVSDVEEAFDAWDFPKETPEAALAYLQECAAKVDPVQLRREAIRFFSDKKAEEARSDAIATARMELIYRSLEI